MTTDYFRLVQVTTGYYKHTYQADKWIQIKQFNASYCLTIYRGCSFEEYLVRLNSIYGICIIFIRIIMYNDIEDLEAYYRERVNFSYISSSSRPRQIPESKDCKLYKTSISHHIAHPLVSTRSHPKVSCWQSQRTTVWVLCYVVRGTPLVLWLATQVAAGRTAGEPWPHYRLVEYTLNISQSAERFFIGLTQFQS